MQWCDMSLQQMTCLLSTTCSGRLSICLHTHAMHFSVFYYDGIWPCTLNLTNLVFSADCSVDYSTSAGSIETLPFRFLRACFPTVLSHPAAAAAISAVLESPALKAFERALNRILNAVPKTHPADVGTVTMGGTLGVHHSTRAETN